MSEDQVKNTISDSKRHKPPDVTGIKWDAYKQEMCQRAIEIMAKGESILAVSAEFGVGKATLYDWMAKYPEFKTAIDRGKEVSELWWHREAQKSLHEDKDRKFNDRLYMINMRNRFGWRSTDKDEAPIVINNITAQDPTIVQALEIANRARSEQAELKKDE